MKQVKVRFLSVLAVLVSRTIKCLQRMGLCHCGVGLLLCDMAVPGGLLQ